MMHLFTEDGKQVTFKKSETVDMSGPKEDPEPEVLYIYPGGWVGYLVLPRMFRIVPQHNVKEIHITREAGKSWT